MIFEVEIIFSTSAWKRYVSPRWIPDLMGVLVLLKLCGAPDCVEFVLGRFSHFHIAIAYSQNSKFFVSSLEICPNFSKTSTLFDQLQTSKMIMNKNVFQSNEYEVYNTWITQRITILTRCAVLGWLRPRHFPGLVMCPSARRVTWLVSANHCPSYCKQPIWRNFADSCHFHSFFGLFGHFFGHFMEKLSILG